MRFASSGPSEWGVLQVHPIEANSGRQTTPTDLRELRALADLPHLRRRIVVYCGERTQRSDDGIEILAIGSFLDLLAGGSLFPE